MESRRLIEGRRLARFAAAVLYCTWYVEILRATAVVVLVKPGLISTSAGSPSCLFNTDQIHGNISPKPRPSPTVFNNPSTMSPSNAYQHKHFDDFIATDVMIFVPAVPLWCRAWPACCLSSSWPVRKSTGESAAFLSEYACLAYNHSTYMYFSYFPVFRHETVHLAVMGPLVNVQSVVRE